MKKKIIFGTLSILLFCNSGLATVTAGETIREFFTCDGNTTTYTFTIPCKSASDIKVYKRLISTGLETLLSQGVDYAITSTSGDYLLGGVITVSPVIASTYKVVIARETVQSQETSSASVNPNSIVASNDKLTRQVQDLQDRQNRSIRQKESDITATLEIPVTRANKFAAFDSNGNFTASAGPITGTIPSDFMETFLQDINSFDARATLGAERKLLVNVKDYVTGGTGSSASPWTGWDTAITWTATEYFFPAGYYSYSTTLDLAKTGIQLRGSGISTNLIFTGTGNAVSFSGAGEVNVLMEGFRIKGTSTTTNGIYINAVHRGILRDITIVDVSGAGIATNFAVLWTMDNIRVSYWYCDTPGTWVQQPVNGILLGGAAVYPAACSTTINDCDIENVSGSGIKIFNGFSNLIIGGSSETNTGGKGLEICILGKQNTIENIDLEGNDSLISGDENNLLGVLVPSSSYTITFDASSERNKIIGGTYGKIANSGYLNIFSNIAISHHTGWTDTGIGTIIENVCMDSTYLLTASATWNPPSIADGNGDSNDVTVAGAVKGDYADASFSIDVNNLSLTANVTDVNTVQCRFNNNTGGAVDLNSGTVYVKVRKR